jgi:hypothetical protein
VFADLPWWIAALCVLVTAPLAALIIGVARGLLQGVVLADDLAEESLRPVVGKVNRWRDFYATSDPVPEDALPIEGLFPEASSTRIANRRSPLLDHTSYWQNAESFRAPVITELARLIGWRPAKPTRKLITQAQADRLRSSKHLVAWRYVFASFAAVVVLLPALGVERATWSDVANWLGGAANWLANIVRGEGGAGLAGYPERHVVAVLVVLLVALALNGTLASRWHHGARQRGKLLLRRMPPPPDTEHDQHHRRWRRPRGPKRPKAGSAGSASG